MFGQPRCREWTPLATQQLRLRTLLQIVGYNLYGNEPSDTSVTGSLYYTLHSTNMSAPFYTSEKLLSNHPKWREIDSELIHKMSSTHAVVRVWKHVRNSPADQIIQTWVVHFSGLLHIGANLNLEFSPQSFKDNTLIFQMSGGYFCSYEKLRPQGIPERLRILPDSGRRKSPSKTIPIDGKRKAGKESKSASPGRINWKTEQFTSKSQSPPNVRAHRDSDSIYEHSPKDGASETGSSVKDASIEESEAAEMYDLIPKRRFLRMNFLTSEIRPSYNAEKLRRLHQLQFSIKNRFRAVQEIKAKIYQRSALESSEDDQYADHEGFSQSEDLSISSREYSLLMGKGRTSKTNIFSEEGLNDFPMKRIETKKVSSPIKGKNDSADKSIPTDRRFTINLNQLLDQKAQPSPSQRLRHACLTKQIELCRFKKRLLQDERDAALANIRRLKEIRSKLCEENQDKGSDLMQKYHSLSKKWDQLKELHKSEAALRELCLRSASLLQARRWSLVQDIRVVYPVKENAEGKLSLLGIHLPACQNATDGLRQVADMDLAVVLGRVAHATALAASLLSIPLRHPLKLMGSSTKVVDHLAPNQNEIPLFARNKDSMMFRYGLFLLNRNIAQLLWAAQRFTTNNPRETLLNLQKLMTPPLTNLDLESSRTFGSASSMETACAAGYGLCHPLSMPTLMPEGTSQQQVPSSSGMAPGVVRRVSHNSLRSLVAVGTDRTARTIVSGGFHNTGNRQFNRFKDCIDGHSPKAAMVIRKHRYSRSVGSYIDEQNYEMSPTSALGSEPSLVMHGENQQSENDLSDSPSENAENAMSFSESDLTKVSDLTSPEVNGGGKVIFSVGDDDSEKDQSNAPPKQKSLEELSTKSKGKQQDGSNLSKENVEIQNLQLDVSQLSKELQQMCSNYSTEKTVEAVPDKSVSTEALKSPSKCQCTVVDIEKLDSIPPYCDENCSLNCTRDFQKLINSNNVTVEDCDDVIVLPSAEAVLTASSHFTEDADGPNGQFFVPDEFYADEAGDVINDCESICEGSSASKDANELLESIKMIEENEITRISLDFPAEEFIESVPRYVGNDMEQQYNGVR